MKILIIGPPGSGKSTLAKQLAKQYSLNHIELDGLKHDKNWQPVNKDEFKNKVYNQLDGGKWIIDGNYISTFGTELIDNADIVIWLDYSFPFVFQRLVRRTLKRTITQEELWNGNRESFYNNFFTSNSVLRHVIHVWKKQRNFYLDIFNNSAVHKKKKMIRVTNPRKLAEATRF